MSHLSPSGILLSSLWSMCIMMTLVLSLLFPDKLSALRSSYHLSPGLHNCLDSSCLYKANDQLVVVVSWLGAFGHEYTMPLTNTQVLKQECNLCMNDDWAHSTRDMDYNAIAMLISQIGKIQVTRVNWWSFQLQSCKLIRSICPLSDLLLFIMDERKHVPTTPLRKARKSSLNHNSIWIV